MATSKKRSHKKKPAPAVARVRKTIVGFVRDHSGSMCSIANAAKKDFNASIDAIAQQSKDHAISVSCTSIGVPDARGQTLVRRDFSDIPVGRVQKLDRYESNGSTPLFDGVDDVIDAMAQSAGANDPETAFLLIATTDGAENASHNVPGTVARMAQLQATDKWTFTFRVPVGEKARFCRSFGVPEGNVLEWEQTEKGFERATQSVNASTQVYFQQRHAGVTSSKSFYTDLSGVKKATVAAKTVKVDPSEVKVWKVDREQLIREFAERMSNKPFLKGAAFYQLTKTEKKVQDYKQILIRDKKSGEIFTGVQARGLLGLPHNGTVRIVPGNHGGFDVFVQSTSVNRKVQPGTEMIYWEKVGTPYIEGVSAPYDKR